MYTQVGSSVLAEELVQPAVVCGVDESLVVLVARHDHTHSDSKKKQICMGDISGIAILGQDMPSAV